MAVGDLNKDGYDDLVIAAPYHGNPSIRTTGKVYICLGKPDFNGIFDFIGTGPDYAPSSGFGYEAQIQDVNGDGYPDLIVGSTYNNNATGEYWTRLHVYRGGSNFTFDAARPHQLIESRKFDFGDISKWWLMYAKALDFNNDGRADINVVHSDWNRKESFVFLSDADSIRLYPQIFIPLPGGAQWFWASRPSNSAGDINGDGYPDFAIRVGLAQLIYYQGSNRGFEQFIMATSQHGFSDQYGTQLAIVGDQNGDGIRDIATNIAFEDGTPSRVIVLGGNSNLPVGLEALDEQRKNSTVSNVYPNPFHSQTHIRVSRKYDANVMVQISDMLGRNIRTLHNGPLQNDNTVLTWDAKSTDGHFVPAGIYLVIISDGMELTTKPMVLLR